MHNIKLSLISVNYYTVKSTGQDPPDDSFKVGTMGDGYDYLVLITLKDGSKRTGKVSSISLNETGCLV